MKDVDWESVANKEDVDSAVSTWNKLFTNIADRHAPMRLSVDEFAVITSYESTRLSP